MTDQTSAIPKGWKITTLGEVADIQPGFAFKSDDFQTKNGFPVVKIKNIQPPIVNIEKDDLVNIDNYAKEKLAKFEIRNGEYLIAMTGETIGKVGKYNLGKFAYINQRVCKIVKTEKSDYGFVYYSLLQSGFQKFIDTHSFGAAQANISTDQIGNFKIIAPSLPEQRAIAAVLSSLDDKIELLREQNKTLETTAQAIFKEWFVNFNFPGATGKMIDSDLGKIPEGWRVGKLEDVTDIVTKGTTPTTIGSKFTKEGVNFIKAESITSDYSFDFSKFSHIDDATNNLLERSKLSEGDLLFTIAGTIGRFAITTNEILPANTNQAVAIIRTKKDFSPYYLLCLLKMGGTMSQLLGSVVEAVQANLSLTSIRNLSIIIPNDSGIEIFKATCDPIFQKIILNNSQIKILSILRDTLLPKLMKGEVKVAGFND